MQKDMGALCRNAAVNAAVLASLQEEGRTAKLRGFEQVAAVHLVPEAFSVENGACPVMAVGAEDPKMMK